jgi:hypothetical protein
MGREYNVIDADGHILEPVDLWDNSMMHDQEHTTGAAGAL